MPQVVEVGLQSIYAFIVLFILARLMGKRQIAQLTFFDYIAGITVGNIAASFSLDDVKTSHALTSLIIWTVFTVGLSIIQRKWYSAGVLLDGKPIVIIQGGKVQEQNLKKANLSVDEMMLLLREKDVFNLTDVEYAVFENNGNISVMKKPELQPLTPKDMRMTVPPQTAPQMLMVNGKVMKKTLQQLGYSIEWLLGEIRKQGARDFSDVAVAQIDSSGNVYADLYNDQVIQFQVKQRPLLDASLKKILADLESYSLETDNVTAKQKYSDLATQVQQLITALSPYLKE